MTERLRRVILEIIGEHRVADVEVGGENGAITGGGGVQHEQTVFDMGERARPFLINRTAIVAPIADKTAALNHAVAALATLMDSPAAIIGDIVHEQRLGDFIIPGVHPITSAVPALRRCQQECPATPIRSIAIDKVEFGQTQLLPGDQLGIDLARLILPIQHYLVAVAAVRVAFDG